jgi:hypothetical protein
MADTKSSAPTPPTGPSGPTLGQRITGFFRAPESGAPRKKPSPTSRFITGSITFILIAELLTYLMKLADVKLNLHLEQPIIGPQAGWLSWFLVINVLEIVAVWIVLQRVGILPRDMFAPRNGTTTRSSASASKSSGGATGASQIPGIGKARTRAERRHTSTVKTTQVASGKNGKSATTSATAQETLSTEHDEVYDRVRAAQRLRKRRATR